MTLVPPAIALAFALAQAPAAAKPSQPQAAPQPPPPPAPVAPAPAPVAPQPPQPTTTLTLDDALRQAGERNLDLKAAASRLRQAEQGYWKATAGYLPTVTLGGTYTHQSAVNLPFPVAYDSASTTPVPGAPPTVHPLVTQSFPVVPGDQLQFTADASQVLFAPGLWYAISAASSGTDAARQATENARRSILFGTAQAYYGVASLRQLVQVDERLLEIAQRQEKDTRVRYQAGTVAKVGLLRAEIDRARAEQDLQRARNSYQSARLALAQLLDRPADFDVVDPEEPKLPPDPAKLADQALQDRPDVKSARSQLEAAQAAKKAQWGGYLPTVAAFGHYQNADKAGLTGKELWSVGLAAKWNILDGGLREANVREANARAAEAETNLASTEAKAKLEVNQALLDLDSARANAAKAMEQRELAAENARLVDVSYRAGAATAVEQADATAQLRNAELAQTSETLNARLAALRVLQAAGANIR
jgi:outer membrane protein TolC